MPELEYFLVSESVSTDERTGYFSLFNILEDMGTVLPLRISRLIATSCWNISPEEQGRDYQVSLRILQPNGEILEGAEDIAINFTAEGNRQRIHHELRGVSVPEAGDWVFEILLNGEHKAKHVLTVREQDASA